MFLVAYDAANYKLIKSAWPWPSTTKVNAWLFHVDP